jgi:hypothetical protein
MKLQEIGGMGHPAIVAGIEPTAGTGVKQSCNKPGERMAAR